MQPAAVDHDYMHLPSPKRMKTDPIMDMYARTLEVLIDINKNISKIAETLTVIGEKIQK